MKAKAPAAEIEQAMLERTDLAVCLAALINGAIWRIIWSLACTFHGGVKANHSREILNMQA